VWRREGGGAAGEGGDQQCVSDLLGIRWGAEAELK
jgi:hypothetical protein